MRKWIVMIICLFLVACSNSKYTADTPEEALDLIHSNGDFAKVADILNFIQISEKQTFYVFKGEMDNQTEWYVANIEKDEESKWFVKEAINIGLPSGESEIHGTNTFTAGIGTNTEEVKDSWKIVDITDDDFVWIELEEN